ncbi:MAG: ribonuclease E/G, partial [Lachnospiraceae bacterium]|nr:ribonuclease E/G [Lachnospiraceae bacterium]
YAVVGIRPKGQKGGVQISAKLDAEKQAHFRESEALLRISERFRLIVRTNAGTLEREETLLEEAQTLADTLAHILEIAPSRTCYSCLYRNKPDYAAFVENAYRTEYEEVITDLPEVYDTLLESCKRADIPLRLYADELLPLYKLYSVEQRLQELSAKKVWLKSGGYLVIEPTEALISIDVNTGKYEAGKDKEETFYRINREAAEMIALHLRARNLSGMILVDFINLKSKEREKELLEYMRGLLKKDPIPAKAVDMTALGLMELTRKKVSPSLAEQLGSQ